MIDRVLAGIELVGKAADNVVLTGTAIIRRRDRTNPDDGLYDDATGRTTIIREPIYTPCGWKEATTIRRSQPSGQPRG